LLSCITNTLMSLSISPLPPYPLTGNASIMPLLITKPSPVPACFLVGPVVAVVVMTT
jgi:hypothetical protein